jgi:hypothetical protein
MPEYEISYRDTEDGCVYCIDKATGNILKVCAVSIGQVSENVRAQMKADKERLAVLRKIKV